MTASPPPDLPNARPGSAEPRGAIAALRARWRRPPWQRGLVPVALLVGVAFLLLRPTPAPRPELPAYRGVTLVADAPVPGPLVLARGAPFVFELRPAHAIAATQPVGPIRGWRLCPDHPPAAWRPNARLDPGGTVRIDGEIGRDLPAEPGACTLVFTLGPGAPEDQALVTALAGGTYAHGPGWQAVTFAIEVR